VRWVTWSSATTVRSSITAGNGFPTFCKDCEVLLCSALALVWLRVLAKELAVGAMSRDDAVLVNVPFVFSDVPRLTLGFPTSPELTLVRVPIDDTREGLVLFLVPTDDVSVVELVRLLTFELAVRVTEADASFKLPVLELFTVPDTLRVEDRVNEGIGDRVREDAVDLTVPVGLGKLDADSERLIGFTLLVLPLLLLTPAPTARVDTGAVGFGGGGPIVGSGLEVSFDAGATGLDSVTPLFQTFCTIDFADERKPNRFFSADDTSVKV
jgi:hypothetical protein